MQRGGGSRKVFLVRELVVATTLALCGCERGVEQPIAALDAGDPDVGVWDVGTIPRCGKGP